MKFHSKLNPAKPNDKIEQNNQKLKFDHFWATWEPELGSQPDIGLDHRGIIPPLNKGGKKSYEKPWNFCGEVCFF